MKVIILGSNGMIGRGIYAKLSKNPKFQLYNYDRTTNLDQDKLDLENPRKIVNFLGHIRPDVVINCVGIIKQNKKEKEHIYAINSFFPHKLNYLSVQLKFKLIQISTDCVFSGLIGNYKEDDIPDAKDDYGLSKHLGEIYNNHNLTIRSSVIGHENHKQGLLEWFLSQKNECAGYKNAIYTGFTSNHFSEIIENILISHFNLNGIVHLSSVPISKYDLLSLIAKIYNKSIKIIPDEKVKIDRSLNSNKFKQLSNFKFKSWHQMIQEMKDNENAKR